MFNTSVMDVNSSSAFFSFSNCVKETHTGMVVYFLTLSLCFFLGNPAHCWLLWLYLYSGWKIKPTQVFLFNMTVLELIFSTVCGVQLLNVLIFTSGISYHVLFFVYGLSCVGRPLIQVCICVEQYLAVIHPVVFLKYKALQYRIVLAALVWVMAALISVYEMLMKTLVNHIFNFAFFISVIIISFCCVSVLRALKLPGPGDTQITVERGRDVGNQQKRKAFNTIFSGLLIILITYLPQVSLTILNLITMNENYLCNIFPLLSSIPIVGVMTTPLIKMYKKSKIKCFTHPI